MNRILRWAKFTPVMAFLMLLLGNSQLLAQSSIVSGVVREGADGETLPGVSVVEKGTTNGVTTDINGKFSLSVPPDAVLVISYIGMKTMEVAVGNRSVLEIGLEADLTELSEIVIIGYGSVEKRELTSSVSSVSAKQLKHIPINSASEALSGRLAGVQVITSEGSPNADIQIRVRGGGSITQDNNPLYIVDGVQVPNALSILSPQDIESVDVLKDASATAIYGAQGANGVVMITTKGGREAKTTVSYSGLVGVRQLANKLEVMSPYDFVMYQYERSRGSNAAESGFLETYGHYEDLENYKDVPFVDWQEEVFGRDAAVQTHNVSITGGSKTTSFGLSATSQQEEGVMLATDFDRKLVNFRFDHQINDKLKTGFNFRYNNTLVNGAGTATAGSSSVNRLRHSVKYRPLLFPGQGTDTYDPDYAAETNANSLALVNPILLTAAEYKQTKSNVSNINTYLSYKITDNITFRSTLGYDITNTRNNVFNDTITNVSRLNGSSQPIASIQTNESSLINNSNVLTYASTIGKHKMDFLIGQEVVLRTFRSNYIESRLFPVGITAERALGSMALGTPQIPTSNEESDRILSYFSRANYAYDDKYMLTVSLRGDGSSKFSSDLRWAYFPSVAAAWRISEESFFEGMKPIANDMKLRVSYGEAGNNQLGRYLYLPLFVAQGNYTIDNSLITGFRPFALANNNLKWETTVSKNIGVDISFLENRIQLSADFYRNDTRDLLLDVQLPSTSGYQRQIQNVGSTSNRGLELQLSGTPIKTRNFDWNSSFNISFNKNRIEDLGTQEFFLSPSGWGGQNAPADYIVKEGESVGTIWGLQTDGFYTTNDFDYDAGTGTYTLKEGIATNQSITALTPKPGVLKFKDISGPDGIPDGIVDDFDRTIIGNALPKFFGGFNQQITFKGFDLNVFFNFQVGNDVLNANKLEFTSGYTPNSNMLAIMNDRWTNVNSEGVVVTDPDALNELNANATLWSPLTSASSFYPHSWAVEDASFIRLNNITLGYSLPKSVLERFNISNFRVYATGNNLAVFTNYSGYDPEVNTRRSTPTTPGVDYAAYPRSRAYIVGVNLTF